MATGTMKWFAQGLLDLGNKIHNLSSDTLKLGIVTTATVPSLSTAAPHWGGTGTTNFATNQVSTGGTQYTGPKTLASVTWTLVSNVATLRATDISMTIDASGFTNGAYGIIYNDTDANKRALGFVELSAAGTLSLQAGAITIDWGGAGTDLFTITQS
jgi:hypothetical protein